MCQISMQIPEAVLYDTHMDEADASSFAKKMVALGYYTKNNVSIGYCSQIAEMPEEVFIRFLGEIHEGSTVTQEGGVVIGKSNSNIKLKLQNDVLYFFTGDEKIVTESNALAWFKSNQLFVNNSTIQNLTLGTTGAYLDARIVGTGDNRCVLWSGRMS